MGDEQQGDHAVSLFENSSIHSNPLESEHIVDALLTMFDVGRLLLVDSS